VQVFVVLDAVFNLAFLSCLHRLEIKYGDWHKLLLLLGPLSVTI